MAVAKVRRGGVWVGSKLAGKARVGGAWVPFGPADEPPPAPPLWLFTDQTPANPGFVESGPSLTLGTVVNVTEAGQVAGGRWLFPATIPAGMAAAYVLYDNTSGAELRRVPFTSPTPGQWAEVSFAPHPVDSGASLVAAVNLTGTSVAYPYAAGLFAAEVSNGTLRGPVTSADPRGIGNGRFSPGDTYPGMSYNATSYFVDLLFEGVVAGGGSVVLAGPDRPVVAGQSVGVDVVAANLAAGETVTGYAWSVRSGGGSLANITAAVPTYTAPAGSGVAVVRATVTTSLGRTGWGEVRVGYAGNIVAAENTLPGTARATWDLPVGSLGGLATLQGFCDGLSADKSEVVRFKIGQSDGAGWSASLFRLGWYGGDGARLVATLTPSGTQLAASQAQPAPLDVDPVTTLPSVDAGNWASTLEWTPPSWAPSGMYVLRLDRNGGGGASHVLFVLRDDGRAADLMFMPSDSTWQAYNAWGGLGAGQYAGNSLYFGTAVAQYDGDAARYVSYNRPIVNRGAADPGRSYGAVKWSNFFTGEYPALRWLERNGYDYKAYACIDAAGDPTGAKLANVGAAMFVGHNEYWSNSMRAGWEAAKAGGTHVFACASNEVFWRLVGSSPDSSGRPRTWECFKSTIAARGSTGRAEWTGTWRDPDGAGKGGNAPENTFTGTIFVVNGPDMRALKVPAAGGYSATPLWRHTPVAALAAGQTWTSPDQILGFEWDTYGPGGVEGPGAAFLADPHPDAVFCSDATYSVAGVVLTDAGDEYGSGNVTHRLVVHPGGDGALVFGTGTINWALGLDSANFYQAGNDNTSTVIQQATANMLADMGAAPATLMSGLTMPTPVNWYGPTPPAEEALTMGVPVGPDWTEPNTTLGTRFTVSEAGDWIGMRIWATPTATGITPSIMAYNHDTGARLAIKQYTEPTQRSQYHDVLFDTPVPVSPGVNYQGAVHTTRYGYTPISGLTLPVQSPSGRVSTSSNPAAIATFSQGVTPAATAPTSSGSNLTHISPIVAFP